MKDLLFHNFPFTKESTGLLNRVLDVMKTHNGATRRSEGLLCWNRTLEIAHSFLFSNRNNAVIERCVRHHALVTQAKLHCMEVTAVLSSSHLLRQRTRKHAGKETCEHRFLQKVSWKSKFLTPDQLVHMPSFQKDGHPHQKTSSSQSPKARKPTDLELTFKDKKCVLEVNNVCSKGI